MQKANPTETFPLVVYEAGYDRMVEQFMPLVLDLNFIETINGSVIVRDDCTGTRLMHHLTISESGWRSFMKPFGLSHLVSLGTFLSEILYVMTKKKNKKKKT